MQGWRGTLLEISHEEMIHYLLVNNVIMQQSCGVHEFDSGRELHIAFALVGTQR